jgi:hypothetical protein
MADRPTRDRGVTGRTARTTDRSPWNWLLLVPVLAVLWPPLFNRNDPELFGIPFFYWYQLAVIPVGVACTYLVYRASVKADEKRGNR